MSKTTQQGETLEPCPWCGKTPKLTKIEGSPTNPELVGCETDHCPMTLAMTPSEWNTRPAAVAGPPNEELRSACCDAPTRIANTDYNVCTACKEACDTVTTATSSPALTEKLPLPTNYECIAPSEQVYVINLLRGICDADADKQEVARLHLNLCFRCQELAGGVVPAENTRVAGEQLAIEIVGTVFDNTGASHETLKATMIERITDWLHRAPSDSARRAAEEIVPDCLSRTCFMEDCGYDHCWGCDDSRVERERVAAIISKHFTAAPADNDAE